ncbi:hypothetical protein AACH10_13710 [Ideonella sp. DXS22W]|uniref:Uncharacterized protein n=1 Tax=Pseudaquabacterium inlustre TaxID=2984192 RepID=A0ABU9CL40_9BURK
MTPDLTPLRPTHPRRPFSFRHPLALCAALLLGAAHAAGPAVTDLPFSQFFQQPIGPRGLQPTAALRAADGQRVRLVGYMVQQEHAQPGRFLLAPRPVSMSEHADGEADDLPPATVTVLLDAARADHLVPHRAGRIALVGRLSLGRVEDAEGRVSWVRLQLEAEPAAKP